MARRVRSPHLEVIAHTWTGRRGAVLLGPTEHRVAVYLENLTRSGRVQLRTTDLASRLNLERSEAYRITRRLRILGLFGVENDPSGSRGGRRWWRTRSTHDGSELNRARHAEAIARLVGWARRLETLTARRLAELRATKGAPRVTAEARRQAPRPVPPRPAGEPFPLERWIRELAPGLAAEWWPER